MSDFEKWWLSEGHLHVVTYTGDEKEHIKIICKIAWNNGAFNATQDTINNKRGESV